MYGKHSIRAPKKPLTQNLNNQKRQQLQKCCSNSSSEFNKSGIESRENHNHAISQNEYQTNNFMTKCGKDPALKPRKMGCKVQGRKETPLNPNKSSGNKCSSNCCRKSVPHKTQSDGKINMEHSTLSSIKTILKKTTDGVNNIQSSEKNSASKCDYKENSDVSINENRLGPIIEANEENKQIDSASYKQLNSSQLEVNCPGKANYTRKNLQTLKVAWQDNTYNKTENENNKEICSTASYFQNVDLLKRDALQLDVIDTNDVISDDTFQSIAIKHVIDEKNYVEREEGFSDSSNEYDTDIEEDFPEAKKEPFDPSGRKIYRQQCLRQQIVPITSFVEQLPKKMLELRFRGMNNASSTAIASSLTANSRIERCDLSNNNLGSSAGKFVVEVLRENSLITYLDLSENKLGCEVGCQLAEILLTNTYIKNLFVKGNKFTDRVAKMLAEVLKVNRFIEELDLSYNEFREAGSLYLGAGLALNESVEYLNLKWNSIRGKGCVAIAASLSKNNTLKKLDLSWNGISFIGCLAIGRHLKKNTTIEYLDISNNRIGSDAPSKLVDAISTHPALETLKIGLNPLGDEGVQTIIKASSNNAAIRFLSFESITICDSTQKMIDTLQASRDITIATGGSGGFSKGKPPPGSMEVLVQFIKDNRMRLTDVFFRFDKDRNDQITKSELIKGLMSSGLKMNKAQISNLIDQLDTNNDGNIEFSEILNGQQIVVKEQRFKKKINRRTKQMEKESIRLPKIQGF